MLAACDGAKGAASTEPPKTSAVSAEPAKTPRAEHQLSESDHIALEQAKRACENRDFKGLFTAMAVSDAVRQQYSASAIEVSELDAVGKPLSTRQISSGAYNQFPVKLVDYYYKPTAPLRAGDEDEYLDIQFNQSQNDDFAVDWARVHYDGQSQGGDDLGNILGPDGRPLPAGTHPDADGQLLFRPVGDCWQLSEDIRWRR